MNGQWPFCEMDEFWHELKQAALNILHENPATDCSVELCDMYAEEKRTRMRLETLRGRRR